MDKKELNELIENYINDNEEFSTDEIICPYCKKEQTDVDPSIKWNEQEDEGIYCEHCGREFILNSSMYFHYTTNPTKEEAEAEILDAEMEMDKNGRNDF